MLKRVRVVARALQWAALAKGILQEIGTLDDDAAATMGGTEPGAVVGGSETLDVIAGELGVAGGGKKINRKGKQPVQQTGLEQDEAVLPSSDVPPPNSWESAELVDNAPAAGADSANGNDNAAPEETGAGNFVFLERPPREYFQQAAAPVLPWF